MEKTEVIEEQNILKYENTSSEMLGQILREIQGRNSLIRHPKSCKQ